MTTAHLSAARRTPVQERSAARVERMLDAAAALLDAGAAPTTSAVAQRAGVSVGSLYQFFPDQSAVLRALAQRSFDRYRDALLARLAASPPACWQDLVRAVVEGYVAFARDEPGFRQLNLGGPFADSYDNGLVASALGDVLAEVLPEAVRSPQLDLALRVAVESGEAVLALAFRRDPDGDPALVAELERFLVAGLADLLSERLPH